MNNNVFYVIIDDITGKYLHGHNVYGTWPITKRVILTKDLCDAKLFKKEPLADDYLKSRTDFQYPEFKFFVQKMDVK